MQDELAGVELRERLELEIEQLQAEGDDQPGHDPAEQSLCCAEIQERAADEAVGRAYQFGNFDLAALCQDLQADGVERDRDQRQAEQAGQDQYQHAPEFEQCLQLVSPGRIELCLFHLGQLRQFVAQRFQRLRLHGFGINDEGIRQRVLLQAADHVGKAGALLELFQRSRAGDKLDAVYGRVLRELRAQFADLVDFCIQAQEQADLRCAGELRDQALHVLQQQVHAGGQAERDADDQDIEEPSQPRREDAAQCGAQYGQVLYESAHHACPGRVAADLPGPAGAAEDAAGCNSPCFSSMVRTLVS